MRTCNIDGLLSEIFFETSNKLLDLTVTLQIKFLITPCKRCLNFWFYFAREFFTYKAVTQHLTNPFVCSNHCWFCFRC